MFIPLTSTLNINGIQFEINLFIYDQPSVNYFLNICNKTFTIEIELYST